MQEFGQSGRILSVAAAQAVPWGLKGTATRPRAAEHGPSGAFPAHAALHDLGLSCRRTVRSETYGGAERPEGDLHPRRAREVIGGTWGRKFPHSRTQDCRFNGSSRFPEDTTSYGTGIEPTVRIEADVESDGHDGQDDERRRRTSSRWWRSRAQSVADDAIAETTSSPDDERRQQLADLGHELKSPLSIMLALCTRLEEAGRLAPEDADDVARIRANAYTMLRRVQDLMLVSRLENVELQLEAAIVDVAAIVRTCAEGFGSVAAQRDLDLRIGVPARLPAVADEEKIVSVVSNLLANAIRHAPSGGSCAAR